MVSVPKTSKAATTSPVMATAPFDVDLLKKELLAELRKTAPFDVDLLKKELLAEIRKEMKKDILDACRKAMDPSTATEPAKKIKKVKDPNAPKPALQPYMLFCKEKRISVVDANPGKAFGQIGKLLGSAWKALSDTDKAHFVAMAEADKTRYATEIASYVPTTTVA
jgi:hypothetical protein